MGIFTAPPRLTKVSFKEGDTHLGVYSIQVFIKRLGYPTGALDGVWGPKTERAVRDYQEAHGLVIDGIVGPATQAKIANTCVNLADHHEALPHGLAEGQIQAESGSLIAAANSQIAGGIDYGYTQIRIYGPPYEESKIKAAANPITNVGRANTGLYDNYQIFSDRVGRGEYAWRLAALAHNWPWAANELSYGRALSMTKIATWGRGARFDDNAAVHSYRDWAEFYALGSAEHNHAGLVTKLAFGVPKRRSFLAAENLPEWEPIPKPSDHVPEA